MKKLFYGLGAIAAVATPIVAVVSCGSKSETSKSQFDSYKTETIEAYKKACKDAFVGLTTDGTTVVDTTVFDALTTVEAISAKFDELNKNLKTPSTQTPVTITPVAVPTPTVTLAAFKTTLKGLFANAYGTYTPAKAAVAAGAPTTTPVVLTTLVIPASVTEFTAPIAADVATIKAITDAITAVDNAGVAFHPTEAQITTALTAADAAAAEAALQALYADKFATWAAGSAAVAAVAESHTDVVLTTIDSASTYAAALTAAKAVTAVDHSGAALTLTWPAEPTVSSAQLQTYKAALVAQFHGLVTTAGAAIATTTIDSATTADAAFQAATSIANAGLKTSGQSVAKSAIKPETPAKDANSKATA